MPSVPPAFRLVDPRLADGDLHRSAAGTGRWGGGPLSPAVDIHLGVPTRVAVRRAFGLAAPAPMRRRISHDPGPDLVVKIGVAASSSHFWAANAARPELALRESARRPVFEEIANLARRRSPGWRPRPDRPGIRQEPQRGAAELRRRRCRGDRQDDRQGERWRAEAMRRARFSSTWADVRVPRATGPRDRRGRPSRSARRTAARSIRGQSDRGRLGGAIAASCRRRPPAHRCGAHPAGAISPSIREIPGMECSEDTIQV
jgi:hypothetical protein